MQLMRRLRPSYQFLAGKRPLYLEDKHRSLLVSLRTRATLYLMEWVRLNSRMTIPSMRFTTATKCPSLRVSCWILWIILRSVSSQKKTWTTTWDSKWMYMKNRQLRTSTSTQLRIGSEEQCSPFLMTNSSLMRMRWRHMRDISMHPQRYPSCQHWTIIAIRNRTQTRSWSSPSGLNSLKPSITMKIMRSSGLWTMLTKISNTILMSSITISTSITPNLTHTSLSRSCYLSQNSNMGPNQRSTQRDNKQISPSSWILNCLPIVTKSSLTSSSSNLINIRALVKQTLKTHRSRWTLTTQELCRNNIREISSELSSF